MGVFSIIIGEYCDVFPPNLDGVGMVVENYVKSLTCAGDECYYVAPRAKVQGEQELNTLLYYSVKIAGERYRLGLPILDLSYQQRAGAIKFDIVHAHSPFTAGNEAIRIARLQKIPVVATFHSKYYEDFYSITKSRVLAKTGTDMVVRFYNRCDEVWTVNNATAEVLRGYGYKRDIFIMPNGTNLWYPTQEDRISAQEKYSLGDTTVLLFVGQMNWKKNIRCVIDALALLKKRIDFKMLMVGQGPSEHEIRDYVSQQGLEERVIFTGHIVDRRELMSIYARADLFLFPSIYDNAPMVLREAAAAGTPAVLISGSCASEGVNDGKNGFLCKNSPSALCEAVIKALPLAPEVGAAARQTIPLDWSVVMSDVRERYENLIRRGGKRTHRRRKE